MPVGAVQLALLPVVGGLIGWLTNVLAIALLFRPYRPIRIPILGFEIQGLIPRRRAQLTRTIAAAVEKELLSGKDIAAQLGGSEVRAEILRGTMRAMERGAVAKLRDYLPAGAASAAVSLLGRLFYRRAALVFDRTMDNLAARLSQNIELAQLVERRLDMLDIRELEGLIRRLAAKEIRHIEILGGIIGFVVGLAEAALLLALRAVS